MTLVGAALILAAGSSERFGADKRLAEIDGQPMIVKALKPYLANIQSVHVVVRPDDPVQAVLPTQVDVIEAPDAYLGMGHSLAAAATQLAQMSWFLVGLADMPWIRADTVDAIATCIQSQKDAIVRPSFRGQAGHPVGFTANYLDELKSLSGDAGAKEVLQRHRDKLIVLELADEAIVRDVDTPQQLHT